MNITALPIDGLFLAESTPHEDSRGAFSRLFCQRELSEVIGKRNIVQVNYSHTKNVGAIRGLHLQNSPSMETKLIRCLSGLVFDVAVDLRSDSKTFLHWHSEILSPENNKMMVIPEGFAHGFQAISRDAKILYLHTEFYDPESEFGLRYDEPRLKIKWPLPHSDISVRDNSFSYLDENFVGVNV